MKRRLLSLGLVFAACGQTPQGALPDPDAGSSTIPDAGVVADAGIPPPCELGSLPDRLSTTPGGRLSFALHPSPGATAEVEAPANWRVDARDPANLRIRVPYDTSGTSALQVRVHCGDRSAEGSVMVDVAAMAWSRLAEFEAPPSGPAARQFASLWFDPLSPDRLLIQGGFAGMNALDDLWEFVVPKSQLNLLSMHSTNLAAPSAIAPSSDDSSAYVFDEATGGSDFTLLKLEYGEEGLRTSTVVVTNPPAATSAYGAFVFDAAGQRYVSACGYFGNGLACRVDTFDPATGIWEEREVTSEDGTTPSGRYGFAQGYDRENARLVIFSGGQTPTPANPVNPAQDTWALALGADPIRWVKLSPGGEQPPGRRNSCSAVDPVGHRLFVWGGTPDLMNVPPGLYALDLDLGFEAWTRIEVPGEPPARSGCAATYDVARHQLIVGFGNTRSAIYRDLFALQL